MVKNGITDFAETRNSIIAKGFDLTDQPMDATGFPSLGYGDLMG